jgi:hypothetical protein
MICGLRIGNFKAFSETQYMPIRPLTLIFGPNSSGKSSLIHALVLAHEAMRVGALDIHRTEIGGDSVDLGGFRQYIFGRDTGRNMELSVELDAGRFTGRIGDIFSSVRKVSTTVSIGMVPKRDFARLLEEILEKEHRLAGVQYSKLLQALQAEVKDQERDWLTDEIERYTYQSVTIKEFLERHKEPRVTKYTIGADGVPILKMSLRKEGFLRLDFVNSDHPVIKSQVEALVLSSTTTNKISSEEFKVFDEAISKLVLDLEVEVSKFIANRIRGVKQISYLSPISRSRRHNDLISAFNLFFPKLLDEIIGGLSDTTKRQFLNFRYLGPLRSYPPRHLAFAQYHDPNWNAGGGFAWDEVRKNEDLRNKINQWLGDANKLRTCYELIVQHLLTIDQLEKHYTKRISEIEREFHRGFDLGEEGDGTPISEDRFQPFDEISNIPKDLKRVEQYLSEIGELVLRDKRSEAIVSHRDVGIGISQVLPVLVSAYANKNSIVTIEQPEIHLHPGLQAELGDVFIESALGENKNTFIIESHSEHLLLRIMRRIRETTSGNLPDGIPGIHPEDVMVLFVEPKGSSSIVHEMPLDEKGDLMKPWPGGFFEEDFKELF